MKRWFILSLILWSSFITISQAAESPARLRFIHAVPDAVAVDILLNGEVAFEEVAFAEITDYLPLEPQSYDLKIQLSTDPGAYILADMITVEAGQDYTLATVGKLVLLETLLVKDNPSSPISENVELRLVHLSPNAPTLDMLAKNGLEASLFNEATFKDASTYIPLHADSYDVTLKVAGTSVVALEMPNIELVGGRTYSLFVVGLAGGEPSLQIVVETDTVLVPSATTDGAGVASATESETDTELEEETAETIASEDVTMETDETDEAESIAEPEEESAEAETTETVASDEADMETDETDEAEAIAEEEPVADETSDESETVASTATAEPVSLSSTQIDALSAVEIEVEQQLLPAQVAPDTMPVTGDNDLPQAKIVSTTTAETTVPPSTIPVFMSLIILGLGAWVAVQAVRTPEETTTPTTNQAPRRRR